MAYLVSLSPARKSLTLTETHTMDYELSASAAFLRIDDGKANVVGHSFLDTMPNGRNP